MKKTRLIVIAVLLFALCLYGCADTPIVTPTQLIESETLESGTHTPASSAMPEPPLFESLTLQESISEHINSVSTTGNAYTAILNDGTLVNAGLYEPGDEYPNSDKDNVIGTVINISSSRWVSLAIDTEGALWGWGTPLWGQLMGAEQDERGPIILMENVQLASAGLYHCLALRTDGTVWTWGSGESGVIGDGLDTKDKILRTSSNPLKTPVKVLENAIYICASEFACYAIKEDGTLWAWGDIGIADKSGETCRFTPEPIMSGVKYVSGGAQALAIKDDGSLWAWGKTFRDMAEVGGPLPYFERGEPTEIMNGVRYAYSGWERYAVIKEDGSLWVWGDNRNGALGDGTDEFRREPQKVMDNIAFVTSSEIHILAVTSSGELWELGTPAGLFNDPETGEWRELTDEELFQSRLPHKIMDGILVP